MKLTRRGKMEEITYKKLSTSFVDLEINGLSDFLMNQNMLDSKMLKEDAVKTFTKFFSSKSNFAYVAMSGEDIVGSIFCTDDGFRAYLNKLVVKEEFRVHGIGKKLVLQVIDELKKSSTPEVSIICRPFLAKWYESMGFAKVEGSMLYKMELKKEEIGCV
jgi:predicted GNAT family N-acyltransferase